MSNLEITNHMDKKLDLAFHFYQTYYLQNNMCYMQHE